MSEIWLQRYKQGTFRNVPFNTKTAERKGGRKVAIIELQGKDEPDIQDHGKKSVPFSFECYINGDNYFSNRDALIDALDGEGPGLLIHPYYNRMLIQVLDYSVIETESEGRMCRFQITVIKASADRIRVTSFSSALNLLDSVKNAYAKLNDAFLKAYSIAKLPYSAIDKAKKVIGLGVAAVDDAKLLYSVSTDFQNQVDSMLNTVDELVTDANQLNIDTFNLLTFGTTPTTEPPSEIDNAIEQLNDLFQLFDFKPGPDTQKGEPAAVYADYIVFGSIFSIAGLMAIAPFSSIDEADEVQQKVFKKIDELIWNGEVSDELYESFIDIRSKIAIDTEERTSKLPTVKTIQKPHEIAAVLLSYQLYGTIERESEIVGRNNSDYPGFLASYTPIEVLSE